MPYPIPVRRVLNLANPVESPPWDCGNRLSQAMVSEARSNKDWLSLPVSTDDWDNPLAHARRIAYLAHHGWTDPIEIDVGIPSMACYPDWAVEDGNHRLYAAVLRGDSEILATIAGDLGYAAQRFGIKAKLLEEQPAN